MNAFPSMGDYGTLCGMLDNINQFSAKLNEVVQLMNDIDSNTAVISTLAKESNEDMQTMVKTSGMIIPRSRIL